MLPTLAIQVSCLSMWSAVGIGEEASKRNKEKAQEQWEWEHGGKSNLIISSSCHRGGCMVWRSIPIVLKHSFLSLSACTTIL
jgi:hypothetical protein